MNDGKFSLLMRYLWHTICKIKHGKNNIKQYIAYAKRRSDWG